MSHASPPPGWRLPEGVNASLWHYAHTDRLAEEEDDYFRNHPLFEADARALDSRFLDPGPLVDLGCGTGRHALRFAARGFPVVAIDLSRSMLQKVSEKAGDSVSLLPVQANLCRLGALPDGAFAYALSMFSTLGMIRGRAGRRKALREAWRILRPGGRLALHAHNVWLNMRNPQGRAWLVRRLPKLVLGHEDAGDRRMTYRGIPQMEVHLYRWGELKDDLRTAGLAIEEVLPIDEVRAQTISIPWLAHPIRAGGWIVFARRPAR